MTEGVIVPAFCRPDLASDEYLRELGNTKRFAEILQLYPRFGEALRENPRSAVAEFGLEADPEELRLLWDTDAVRTLRNDHASGRPLPDIPLPLRRFSAFLKEKIAFSREWMSTSHPVDPSMAAWRKRQIARTNSELGPAKGQSLVHVPVAIELCVGCSVGCWFCSVSAERLSQKADYAEIKHLWQEALLAIHDVIGDAARWGFCYWATDPLDNPDYEAFCCDFADVFGRFPQTTTAIAWKDMERTKALLKLSREKRCELNRFSILTIGILRTIYGEFSPEELLHVELLPLNKEAGIPKAFSGRARQRQPPNGHSTHDADIASTTSCVSGFLLNMVDRTIRLITPCNASDRWPLGHWVIDQRVFADADDLRCQMNRMIAEHMPTHVKLEREVRFRSDLTWGVDSDGRTPQIQSRFINHDITSMPDLNQVAWEVSQRPGSAEDVALRLELEKNVPLENTLYLLNYLFQRGLLEEEPCPANVGQ